MKEFNLPRYIVENYLWDNCLFFSIKLGENYENVEYYDVLHEVTLKSVTSVVKIKNKFINICGIYDEEEFKNQWNYPYRTEKNPNPMPVQLFKNCHFHKISEERLDEEKIFFKKYSTIRDNDECDYFLNQIKDYINQIA